MKELRRRGMSRQQHDVHVRSGFGEKYWMPIAGYITVAIIGLLYTTYMILNASGRAGGLVGGIWVLIISFGGVVIYPAVFKDAAYLRSTRQRFTPQWWKYILGGLIPPVLFVFAGPALGGQDLGVGLAIFAHALSATITGTVYLYRRHKFVGVP